MHNPVFLENPVSGGVIVFIHGFMGSPRQFDKLSQSAHRYGYSAASLLLPGHGGAVRDFSFGTMKRWQNHVCGEIERLCSLYEHIYLVGHSMGGLLAINAAIEYPGHVYGMLLIACPFKLRTVSAHSLAVRMRHVFHRKSHPVKAAYLDGCSIPLRPSLAWCSVKPAAEFRRLMHSTKTSLPNVSVPVTAVYSAADEVVSIGSLETLRAGLGHAALEEIILSDSLHAYYPEHERILIENALLQNARVM